jgi:hypothetical protein
MSHEKHPGAADSSKTAGGGGDNRLKARLYIGLVHYPIKGKDRAIVQTSVTNLDVHDIARTARTYDLAGYYLIAPPECQSGLVEKIIGHWSSGFGLEYNADRSEALRLVKMARTIDDVRDAICAETGRKTSVVITDAKTYTDPRNITCNSMQNMLKLSDSNFLLLFGTGWGLAEAVVAKADFILEPIRPLTVHKYNHLSVRAAAAIIIDRVVGENIFN